MQQFCKAGRGAERRTYECSNTRQTGGPASAPIAGRVSCVCEITKDRWSRQIGQQHGRPELSTRCAPVQRESERRERHALLSTQDYASRPRLLLRERGRTRVVQRPTAPLGLDGPTRALPGSHQRKRLQSRLQYPSRPTDYTVQSCAIDRAGLIFAGSRHETVRTDTSPDLAVFQTCFTSEPLGTAGTSGRH